jgi:hypothetical protein
MDDRPNFASEMQGRIASEITREELSECFGMPSEEAARRLGIGLTVLKRICRKFGVPRWPYRKLKSLDRLISNVEVCHIISEEPGDPRDLLDMLPADFETDIHELNVFKLTQISLS